MGSLRHGHAEVGAESKIVHDYKIIIIIITEQAIKMPEGSSLHF